MTGDPRLYSPSTLRNRAPILEALRPHLPQSGLVLEVASGTGEHLAHFAPALPALQWQPTDPSPERRASIDAWCAALPNVRPAIHLDAACAPWPVREAGAVLCINMIHIAPWQATEGLIAGASRVLPADALLALYGPYCRRGVKLAAGNASFDADLRRRDPEWGLRELETVVARAEMSGFALAGVIAMPADNLTVLLRRAAGRRS